MNEDQKQIVLGTLLGNGYICKSKKNCWKGEDDVTKTNYQ